jgi:hypothetical protein
MIRDCTAASRRCALLAITTSRRMVERLLNDYNLYHRGAGRRSVRAVYPHHGGADHDGGRHAAC